jgi:tetratricopeptide (TPR) repeat protein
MRWQRPRRDELRAQVRALSESERYGELEALYRARVAAGEREHLCQLAWAVAIQGGRDREAQELFRSALAEGVEPTMAHMNLGELAERAGHVDAAAEHFEIAMHQGQEDQAPVRLATLLEDGPRDAEVDDLYRMAIENGHPSAPAYLARRLWGRDGPDELEPLYRMALARGHGPAPAVELACLLVMHEPGRTAEAAELVRTALESEIRANVLLAVVRQNVVSTDARVWALRTALALSNELDPAHPCAAQTFRTELREQLARTLARNRRFGELEALDRERVDAGDRSHLCNLGYAVAMQGRDAEAIELFEAALAEGVDPDTAQVNLADYAELDGRVEEAIERLGEATRLGHTGAPARLAALLEGGERDSEVEELYRLALERGNAGAAIQHALYLRTYAPDRTSDALRLVGEGLDRGATAEKLADAVGSHRADPGAAVWVLERVARYASHLGADAPCGSDVFRADVRRLLETARQGSGGGGAGGDADQPEAVGEGSERVAL